MTFDIVEFTFGCLIIGCGLVTIIAAASHRFARPFHGAYAPSYFMTPKARRLAWIRIFSWSSILIITGTVSLVHLNTIGMWVRIGLMIASIVLFMWAQLQLTVYYSADLEQNSLSRVQHRDKKM